MNVSYELEISTDEKNLLKEIFICNNEEFADKVNSFSRSASEEYLRMFLGQKIYTRGSDMREYRLFLLIKYFLNGNIPNEQTITTLFQTTHSESKSLLRSVLAKYQYDLKNCINNTIADILINKVEHDEDDEIYYVSNIAENIVGEMNKILSTIDGSLNQITKKRNAVLTFELKPSSYEKLMEYFELEVEA